MTVPEDVGRRVRVALGAALPDVPQARVAADLDMTPDALSRALNGKRAFASIELARVAELTGADVHELITGRPDPHRLKFVARHTYDSDTRSRSIPGRDGDSSTQKALDLAYRQAGELEQSPSIPDSAEKMRVELGDSFVRPFADRIEQQLGVDVVRVAELSTSYSFTANGRHVIALPAIGNWFWENWCLAHELGHLANRHHDEDEVPDQHERAANAFAAELLLPADEMLAYDWTGISAETLAQRVWDLGVSTKALNIRLNVLGVEKSPIVDEWAAESTQKLLRWHLRSNTSEVDAVTDRMSEASARRFPLQLRRSHVSRISTGELGKETLAWMLGVPSDSLPVDVPARPEEPDLDALVTELGLAR